MNEEILSTVAPASASQTVDASQKIAEPIPPNECATCFFWKSEGFSLVSGTCHRYPPVPLNEHQCLWPILKHDSLCGEYRKDASRVSRIAEAAAVSEEEEMRLTRLARELYNQAQTGELASRPQVHEVQGHSPNQIDTLKQATPPILNSQAAPASVKPKLPFSPVLTVDRMKQLQSGRGGK